MKYLKRCLLLGATLFSNYALADGASLTSSRYNGFYLGANIGMVSLYDNENTNNPISDKHDLGASGMLGGLLAGYDFTLNQQIKLGLEAFINGTDVSIADNQNYAPVTSYTVNMNYNAGLRLLPGYEFTPNTIGHIIVGYTNAQFKINDNGNYGIVNSQFNKNGYQLGLGIITAVFRQVSVRTDVIYSGYASNTTNGTTTTVPAGIQRYQNEFSTLEGNLELIYKFS